MNMDKNTLALPALAPQDRRPFFRGLALAAALIVADQLTKWLVFGQMLVIDRHAFGFTQWLSDPAGVEAVLAPENVRPVVLTPFLNFVMVWNEGVSFGLFDRGQDGALVLSALALAIVTGLALWLWQTRDRVLHLALPLIIGGAIGNVIDRLRFGAVADFIDLHVAGYHWPAFNLADSLIVIGAFTIVAASFFMPDSAPDHSSKGKTS
jgi:signal peptidase II